MAVYNTGKRLSIWIKNGHIMATLYNISTFVLNLQNVQSSIKVRPLRLQKDKGNIIKRLHEGNIQPKGNIIENALPIVIRFLSYFTNSIITF